MRSVGSKKIVRKGQPVPPDHIPDMNRHKEPVLSCKEAPGLSDVPTTSVRHPSEDISYKLRRLSIPSARSDITAERHIITDIG